jgi:hypothetical protein
MSDLREMAEPLMALPFTTRPDIASLRRRTRRRDQRRLGVVGISLAVVAASVFAISQSTSSGDSGNGHPTAQLASYFQASVSVPDAVLTQVGVSDSLVVPSVVTPTAATASSDSVVSYVGAEYCPYCALQRWALLVALSKFGTFASLSNAVYSSSTDIFPHLASWSFVGVRYTSPYFTFDPTELTSSIPDGHGGYQPLETMDAGQKASFNQYDAHGSLPFVDLGNGVVTIGANASPLVLEGLTLSQIGADLQEPTNPVAQAVDGTANYLIAGMCSMITGTQPPICNSPAVTTARINIGLGRTPSSGPSESVPTQPSTGAALTAWHEWSDTMHAYLERGLPSLEAEATAGCTDAMNHVRATIYTKTTLGVPPGIKVWGISATGHCSA